MDSEVWLPISTLVLGLVLGFIGDWLREKRTTARERGERWKAFQRETILEAQDIAVELYKRAHEGRIVIDSPSDEKSLWPPMVEVSQALYTGSIRLSALITRIEDEEMRDALMKLFELVLADGGEIDDDALALAVQVVNSRVRYLLPQLY